jgi:glyoxylase-like metal-dependent hydrolase (beta-lactamase superfamily II)
MRDDAHPTSSVFVDGETEATILRAGTTTGSRELFLANVDPALRAELLPTELTVPNGCLLVRTGDVRVLVDTGPSTDAVGAALAGAGVAREEIDVVVITHGHADHVGGLLADGELAFPNARHYLAAVEAAFWTDPATRELVAAEAPGHDAAIDLLARSLPVLRRAGLLYGLGAGDVLAPGVHAVVAPGHTPGHVAVALGDPQRPGLLHLGDVVSHRLHVDDLNRLPVWDLARSAAAIATRQRLFALAADADAVVTASHVPEAGRIARCGHGGFRWRDAQ